MIGKFNVCMWKVDAFVQGVSVIFSDTIQCTIQDGLFSIEGSNNINWYFVVNLYIVLSGIFKYHSRYHWDQPIIPDIIESSNGIKCYFLLFQ